MVRFFSNKNRKSDGVHPSHLLTKNQLQKALQARKRSSKASSFEVLAKSQGLIFRRLKTPIDHWVIRDARSGEKLLECDCFTGICRNSSGEKVQRIRKRGIRGAIEVAVLERKKKSEAENEGLSLEAAAAGLKLVTVNCDQFELRDPATNEILCSYEKMTQKCNVPLKLNPSISTSSFVTVLQFAKRRLAIPQVTEHSVVSIYNRTKQKRLKCAFFAFDVDLFGCVEVLSAKDPLRVALLNKREGDIFTVKRHDSSEEYEILHIAGQHK